MSRAKQVLQNEAQHSTNTTVPAQPNLAPPGPPPMVLQNPLPLQGLVGTALMPPPSPKAPVMAPPTETGVHHLLAMKTDEVNLQTRRNQYGSTTETADPSTASMSKITSTPRHLPPFSPRTPIRWVSNNVTARTAVSYSIMDDLAQTPMAMSSLEVLKTCPM